VATGKLAGYVLKVVVLSRGLPEHGGDAEGERVAANAGEVFAEQVGSPPTSALLRWLTDTFDSLVARLMQIYAPH
jgi:hypothetical protein